MNRFCSLHVVWLALLLFVMVGTTTESILGESTKTVCECERGREAILLRNIKEVTFTKGYYTASRRLSPIPQLECVGGSAMNVYEPTTIRCVNEGIDEPHWRCEADLDTTVKLGKVTITCEGYEGPHDPYVLRDSCGLKYNLEYTSWSMYIYGYMIRAFNIFFLQPLKYLLMATFSSLALLGVIWAGYTLSTAFRAKQRRAPRRRAPAGEEEILPRSLMPWNWMRLGMPEEEEYVEEETEEERTVWSGMLRPRHPSKMSPVGSPTGSAAR
jgi:hypothetical protein